MRLYKLLDGAGIVIPDAEKIPDTEISDIVTHSKRVTHGSMFICIDGLHCDGHDYINAALDAGASVVVTELGHGADVGGAAALGVENTRRAASLLYNSWYGDPAASIKIIAVTGTNGKTSVAYLLRQIFEENGHMCGMIGTVECTCGTEVLECYSEQTANMTTPDPEELYRLLSVMVQRGVEYVFLEATSHASALCKLDALCFDTLIFTNLTQDHLDFHKDMRGYFASKAKLFDRCRKSVLNIDDKYALDFLKASEAQKNILCSANNAKADYFAKDICFMGERGISFGVMHEGEIFDVELSLVGDFALMNSLLAIAVAKEYGISDEVIYRALKKMKRIPGRMERVDLGDGASFSVFVDYAHTPDALEKLLRSASRIRGDGRLILLFGCGGERDRGKRRQMGAVASKYADFVIVTSDNSRGEDREKIIADIYRGINKEKEHIIIPDRQCAIEYAVDLARDGDIVLLAGKGHEKYEINSTGKHPFDEIEIVRSAYQKRFGDV